MTVLEIIQRSSDFLARKGVESPRLQIELLLAQVLGLPRLQLYLNFERVLLPGEMDQLRELVRRRAQREPLQHVLGSTSFCGYELRVDARALVPRPETELLAEQAWERVGRLAPECPVLLDFGTGSGCLAIALALRCPAAEVHALDVSAEALSLARENAAVHGLENRIRFHAGDGFGALPAGMRFDLLMANPPYIPTAEIDGLSPEVRDHDPRLALDGGDDGLRFHCRLAAEAGGWMRSGGVLMLEFGDGQEGAVEEAFEAQKWVVESTLRDYSGRPRILIAGAPGR